jgi:acyl-CoA reductase-like NAD-dependent aldehyde dehydrogenase
MTPPSTTLGPYALKAARHWESFLPQEYAKIPAADRAAFFTRIGDEIERRIEALTGQLTRDEPDPAGETPGYLAGLARLTGARVQAERQVLDEMLPAPPDPEDPEEAAGS